MPIAEKEVSAYMHQIMPKTWHVLTDLKDMKPGHLYIQVFVSNRNKGPHMGTCEPLHYFEKAGLTTLYIHYQFQWQDTVIHELAHIALNRWLSWKTKNYVLVNYGAGKRIKHNAVFKRALNTLYKRAKHKPFKKKEVKRMIAINKTAQQVMDLLTEGLVPGNRHKKIDNSAFLPVVIEDIGGAQIGETIGTLYSVAHYYEQHGDAMRDPEMVFFKAPDGKYYPTMYQQDNMGLYQESVEWQGETIVSHYPELQKDQAKFANTWMRNIKAQQKL